MTAETAPGRYFRLGETYRNSQLQPGAQVERSCKPHGKSTGADQVLESRSPCCDRARRLPQWMYGTTRYRRSARSEGALTRCPDCQWLWTVLLPDKPPWVAVWTSLGPAPGRGWRKGLRAGVSAATSTKTGNHHHHDR